MKNYLTILFCLVAFAAQAQTKTYKYYLNKDLVSVSKEQAVFIGEGTKEMIGFILQCYDARDKNLLARIGFVDSSLSSYNGPYISYHKNLKIENVGNYIRDVEEGLWIKYDSLGRNTDSTVYNAGKKMNIVKRWYWGNGTLRYYEITDSINDTYNAIDYDSNGVINRQFIFKGQLGEETSFKNGLVFKDSLYTREEREAEFPGAASAWRKYLEKNLDPNIGYKKKIKRGVYQVVVKFMIAKDGTVTDIEAETKFGYGLEEEAVRIIKKSGKWIPAKQFGRYVNAYRRQPITYVYE